MKITLAAQEALKQLLQENEANGLHIFCHQGCHGLMPIFQMVRFKEGYYPKDIDGIAILFDKDAYSLLENIAIDWKDGALVLEGVQGCGGRGCNDHSSEDGECCGHCEHEKK